MLPGSDSSCPREWARGKSGVRRNSLVSVEQLDGGGGRAAGRSLNSSQTSALLTSPLPPASLDIRLETTIEVRRNGKYLGPLHANDMHHLSIR